MVHFNFYIPLQNFGYTLLDQVYCTPRNVSYVFIVVTRTLKFTKLLSIPPMSLNSNLLLHNSSTRLVNIFSSTVHISPLLNGILLPFLLLHMIPILVCIFEYAVTGLVRFSIYSHLKLVINSILKRLP